MTANKWWLILLVCFASIANAQTKINPLTQINWPNGYPFTVGNYIAGQAPLTTIQSAIDAASATCTSVLPTTCGSVTIPPGYAGTDTWSSNPRGIIIWDQRPLSILNSTFTNQATQIVDAAQFGAICNGGHDDTAAIQAALNSQWVYNLPLAAKKNITVQLPQGSCLIETPLQIGPYASLVGQGNSTYLVCDYFIGAWRGTDYNCLEMVTTGALTGGASIGQRKIGNFGLIGIGNGPGSSPSANLPNSQAIYISNNINIYGPSTYAFRNITFENMLISDFDTAMDAEDLADSQINFVNVQDVRVGLNFNGDAVAISVNDSHIHNGTWNATTTNTQTYGIIVQINNKYTNGSNVCGVNLFCAPQGIATTHTDVLSFDTDVYQEQCVSCNYQGGAFDQAAGGPASALGGTGYAFQLGASGASGGLSIKDMTLGTEDPKGTILYSQAHTSGASNGIWVTGDYFFLDAPGSPNGTIGIDMAGSGNVGQVSLNDNKFANLAYGIVLAQPTTYSSIRGNSGEGLNNTLIWLSGASSLLHTATVVEDNVDLDSGILAVTEGTATGMRVGWNQSPSQITGSQTVSVAGCTITAGAIGNNCTVSTIPWPHDFPTSTYTLQCSIQSPNGATTVSNAGINNGHSVSVTEAALSTGSTGGGNIVCTGIQP